LTTGNCQLVTTSPCLALTGSATDSYFGKPVDVAFRLEVARSAAQGAYQTGQPLDLCETAPTLARAQLTVTDSQSGTIDLQYDSAPLYGMPPMGCVLVIDVSAADGSSGTIHAAVGEGTLAALAGVLPTGTPSANVGGTYSR
jgi:hypothetical protein